MINELPNLHDWTLVGLSYKWRHNKLTIRVRGWESAGNIYIEGMENLTIPRFEEWGESYSINVVEVVRDENLLLKIEMQSGDLIELRCKAVLWKEFIY